MVTTFPLAFVWDMGIVDQISNSSQYQFLSLPRSSSRDHHRQSHHLATSANVPA